MSLIELIKAKDDDLAQEMVSEPEPVDLDVSDAYGSTALTLAARGGYLDLCQAILRRDPPPPYNAQNIFGSTALMCAAASGHGDVCTELLKVKEIDVNIVTQYGSTALSKAAEAGHASIVEQLLARGADPTVSNKLGKTAAELAAAKGHMSTAQLLEQVKSPPREDPALAEQLRPPRKSRALVSATVCGLRAGNVVCKLDTAVQGPPGTVIAQKGVGLPAMLPVNEKVLLQRDASIKPQGWIIVRVADADLMEKPKKQRCLHPRRPWDKKCVDCPDKRLGR